MENGYERNYYVIDSYCGPEAINPTVKAGTEELNFYSETKTYNRDNRPCANFYIPEEIVNSIDNLIAIVKNMRVIQKI